MTATWLRAQGATCGQVARFERVWPHGVEFSREAMRQARALRLDTEWATQRVSPLPLWVAYKEQVIPLLAAYKEQVAPLWAAYEEQADTLWWMLWEGCDETPTRALDPLPGPE